MISVVIPTLNDERRLTAALAPLVPAAMEGLIRELICVDGGSEDATFEIADDAGAKFIRSGGEVAARVAEGIKAAKGPWVLVLDPGVRLDFGWESAALKHMNAHTGPGRFRLERGEGSWIANLRAPKEHAVLVMKKSPLRLGGGRRLDARGWV